MVIIDVNMHMLTGNAFSVTSSCKRSAFFFILQQ